MTHFTPTQKHDILIHLQTRRDDQTTDDIAYLHGVKGGRRTLNKWKERWNGTAESLETRMIPGRPRLLSRAHVNNLIRTPIRNKNRSHTPISYTQLLPSVRQKSGINISLRTLQNYGARDLHTRQVHTLKTTEEQCKLIHT